MSNIIRMTKLAPDDPRRPPWLLPSEVFMLVEEITEAEVRDVQVATHKARKP